MRFLGLKKNESQENKRDTTDRKEMVFLEQIKWIKQSILALKLYASICQ